MEQLHGVKAKKRNIIIKATQQLILQFGCEKTSIRDIAKEAEVSQVTIYNHFTDKDDLIRVAIDDLINQYIAIYEDIIDSDESFEAKLQRIFALRKDINATNTWFSLVSIAKKDRFILDVIETIYKEKQLEALKLLIEQGKAENAINPDISEKSFAIYINMFKDYYLQPENAILFTEDETLVKDLWELFWNGISSKQ